jgi:hypothetical protein
MNTVVEFIQNCVHRVSDIADAVDEGSVKVKNDEIDSHSKDHLTGVFDGG